MSWTGLIGNFAISYLNLNFVIHLYLKAGYISFNSEKYSTQYYPEILADFFFTTKKISQKCWLLYFVICFIFYIL